MACCLGQDGQQIQSQKQELGSLGPLLMPVMWSSRPHSYCLLRCIFSITLTKYAPRENLREQGFVPDHGLSDTFHHDSKGVATGQTVHVQPRARKRWTLASSNLSPFPPYIYSAPSSLLWCQSSLESLSLSQLIVSRNVAQTHLKMCGPRDSNSSEGDKEH